MIIIVLILAVVLRLVSLNQSLWLDEAINVNVAQVLSLKRLILDYSLGDFHPPLYNAVLYFWIKVFGSSEIATRMPSVIFAIGNILTVYLIGKKLFGRKTGLIAATLLSTAPLHI